MTADVLTAMRSVFGRELLVFWRRSTEVMTALVFFVIVTTLFPLAIGPERHELMLVAPGVLWVAALLATTLSLNHLFASDYQDGSLEQLLMSPHPLSLLVLAKMAAHWVLTGLPLALLSPLLAVQMALPAKAIGTLVVSLLQPSAMTLGRCHYAVQRSVHYGVGPSCTL